MTILIILPAIMMAKTMSKEPEIAKMAKDMRTMKQMQN